MVTPLDVAPGSHVIYRLSDTLVDLGPGYCGAVDDVSRNPAATGLSTFKSMTDELKSQLVLSQAAGATRSLNLSALGDAGFLARYASASAAHDAVLVDAGTSRAVGLTLKALASGTFAVTAVGTATNDGNSANNSATASLSVDAGPSSFLRILPRRAYPKTAGAAAHWKFRPSQDSPSWRPAANGSAGDTEPTPPDAAASSAVMRYFP